MNASINKNGPENHSHMTVNPLSTIANVCHYSVHVDWHVIYIFFSTFRMLEITCASQKMHLAYSEVHNCRITCAGQKMHLAYSEVHNCRITCGYIQIRAWGMNDRVQKITSAHSGTKLGTTGQRSSVNYISVHKTMGGRQREANTFWGRRWPAAARRRNGAGWARQGGGPRPRRCPVGSPSGRTRRGWVGPGAASPWWARSGGGSPGARRGRAAPTSRRALKRMRGASQRGGPRRSSTRGGSTRPPWRRPCGRRGSSWAAARWSGSGPGPARRNLIDQVVCGKVWIWVFDASALGSWGACQRVGAFVVDAAVAGLRRCCRMEWRGV